MRISKVFHILVIMSLLTLLSTSSFFLSDYLTRCINDNNYSDRQLIYALKNSNISALRVYEKKSARGEKEWLELNKKLAVTQRESALKLGHWYKELARNKEDEDLISQAVLWYEQAIRLNSEKAALALATLYYQQGLVSQAHQTLTLSTNNVAKTQHDLSILILRIKVAIHLGDLALTNKLVKLLKMSPQSKDGGDLLSAITYFSILPNNLEMQDTLHSPIIRQLENELTCVSSLQLFATNLKNLKHVERLIKGFNLQQPLAKFVCLPPPKFISAHELSCKAEINQPIVCNEQRWKVIADKVNSRHIGLMLNVGGANVHLGMLYFDLQDTVDIFSHEVSHLLGFVDEYPLVKNHDKCQKAQEKMFSHNIAVLNTYYDGEQRAVREKVLSATPWARYIKRSTPILQPVINGLTKKTLWQVGTPNKYKGEVGLYEAESCQNSSKLTGGYSNTRFSAFKPLNQRTQLRNHSSKFPPQYLDLLKSKPQTYLMPSFHYNIALALYQKGDIKQAKYWLTEAAKWESTPLRKRLIGKGEF